MGESSGITFRVIGGGQEVGANCFQITVNGQSILLDCGTHPKKEGLAALPRFSLLEKPPKVLMLSHAHVDHCGAIPYLTRMYPGVRAFATLPTVRIMDRMLHNSVAVMGTIAKERGITEYPLYEHRDVNFAMRRVMGYDFGVSFLLPLATPVEACFHPAGHVLGSASILLKINGHNFLYTSDICGVDQELMGRHAPFAGMPAIDTLVIESTHGATDESRILPFRQEAERLGEAISKVIACGGSVLVPTFALGRTQEILNIIARLQEEGQVPAVPVYTSGLGRAIYELYDRFTEYLAPGARLRPLEQFGRIGNVWEARVVQRLLAHPSILVATSGMMLANTPSAMIAREMVREKRHGIFFVGYLDSETLGYALCTAPPGTPLQFGLNQPPVKVALENIQRFSFSAHAPRTTLKELVETINPRNVIYVHGDPAAITWMKTAGSNGRRAWTPEIGHEVALES
jgi:cleavage and polyadenylation specificity factor subunit 3